MPRWIPSEYAREMFNPDQIEHMEYVFNLPPEERAPCGWHRLDQPSECSRRPPCSDQGAVEKEGPPSPDQRNGGSMPKTATQSANAGDRIVEP